MMSHDVTFHRNLVPSHFTSHYFDEDEKLIIDEVQNLLLFNRYSPLSVHLYNNTLVVIMILYL